MIDSSSPNQPIQNYEIVNSGLESQVAALLPSVAGYGGNLRSTNTIIPIVDLTAAAEGSSVPESLAQALAFGSQTAFSVSGATTTIVSNTGFFRIFGTNICSANSPVATTRIQFILTDGVSDKIILQAENRATTANIITTVTPFDFICFFAAGESLKITAGSEGDAVGSTRQLADISGTIVTPSGF